MEDVRILTPWERNAFLGMSILAGAFLAGVAGFLVPMILAPELVFPHPVWISVGFVFLGLCLYPLLRYEARLRQPPHVISFRRWLLGCILGAIVTGLSMTWLHTL